MGLQALFFFFKGGGVEDDEVYFCSHFGSKLGIKSAVESPIDLRGARARCRQRHGLTERGDLSIILSRKVLIARFLFSVWVVGE